MENTTTVNSTVTVPECKTHSKKFKVIFSELDWD